MWPKTALSELELRSLYRRYRQGERVADLAAEKGHWPSWLYRQFDTAGLERLERGGNCIPLDDPRAQRMLELWDEGMSNRDIQRELGMGSKTVIRLLTASGREPSRYGPRERHPQWKGGRYVSPSGYVLIRLPVEERSQWGGSPHIPEHRIVMAEHLGRPLRKDETVHHINGKRDDNRLENLQLRSSAHGQGAAMRCADCGSRNLEPERLHDDLESLEEGRDRLRGSVDVDAA